MTNAIYVFIMLLCFVSSVSKNCTTQLLLNCYSLLRRGLFVLWGGWGERKRERAGHDGKGEERREARRFPLPIVPRALSIFSIIDILMGIPSGSLCGGESNCYIWSSLLFVPWLQNYGTVFRIMF